MKPSRARIVLLAANDRASRVVARHLDEHFDLVQVIIERRRHHLRRWRRRAERLGVASAVDQLAFRVLVQPLLHHGARSRIRDLERRPALQAGPWPTDRSTWVDEINDVAVAELVSGHRPHVIAVHGTSILKTALLERFQVPALNLHTGFTPDYRGVHGGYWALVDARPDRFGVTVHRLDRGIDTGPILAQKRAYPGPDDSVVTYPLVQLEVGAPLLCAAIRAVLTGEPPLAVPTPVPSRLHHHPRASRYVWRRVRHDVR